MDCMRLAVRMKHLSDLKKWFRLVVILFTSKLRNDLNEDANHQIKTLILQEGRNSDEINDEEPLGEDTAMDDLEESFRKETELPKEKRIFKGSLYYFCLREVSIRVYFGRNTESTT